MGNLLATAVQGPLQAMDEWELQLWMCIAAARGIAATQVQLAGLIDRSTTRVTDRTEDVQVAESSGISTLAIYLPQPILGLRLLAAIRETCAFG